jgi:hypothetical protein
LEIDYYRALCKTQVEKNEFEQAWSEGKLLSIEDALNEIL